MKSFFGILWNPIDTLQELGEEYSDDLHRKSFWIIMVYSIITAFSNSFQGVGGHDFFRNLGNLSISLAISIFFIFSLSSAIYWVGKTIGGISTFTNIEATFAYSLIPSLIGWAGGTTLTLSGLQFFNWNMTYFYNSILLLGWFVSTNIVFQGVKLFNDFSWKETLLAMSPLILVDWMVMAFYIIYLNA